MTSLETTTRDVTQSDAGRNENRSCRKWLGLLARVIVGGLFVVTGVVKVVNVSAFAEEIQNYGLAPIAMTNAMAIVLPWLEIVAGLALASGFARRSGAWLIAAMLLVFVVVKVIATARGETGDCGCGGDIKALQLLFNNPQGILTNIVLLGMLWFSERSRYDATSGHRPDDSANPT